MDAQDFGSAEFPCGYALLVFVSEESSLLLRSCDARAADQGDLGNLLLQGHLLCCQASLLQRFHGNCATGSRIDYGRKLITTMAYPGYSPPCPVPDISFSHLCLMHHRGDFKVCCRTCCAAGVSYMAFFNPFHLNEHPA